MLHFESETVLKVYNLEARSKSFLVHKNPLQACLFIRSAKNSSGKRNHKQLSNGLPSAVSWRY